MKWVKTSRLQKYVYDSKEIDNLNDIYFKFQKCISGVTYQYIIGFIDIYKNNIMNNSDNCLELYFTEYDIINKYLNNRHSVDYSIDYNINIEDKLVKISYKYLKEKNRILLTNQFNKIENDVYTFNSIGDLIKTDDLSNSFRYSVYSVNDYNKNGESKEYFLINSGNTFPNSNEEKDFLESKPYILKNIISYNILSSGSTLPKLWFTDYNFARKLNSSNYELYDNISINSSPVNNLSIRYRDNVIKFTLNGFVEYNGSFNWDNSSGKTYLYNISNYENNCDIDDYLIIKLSGSTDVAEFMSFVSDKLNGLILDEYVQDYVLSGMTSINIINLNKLDKTNWSKSIDYINNHIYSDFFVLSGNTFPINIMPIENEDDIYIDYDNFVFNFDTNSYKFTSNNYYINYNLFNHLNTINSIFDLSYEFKNSGSTTLFKLEDTYLIDDPSYPTSITNKDSLIKVIPTDINELSNFYNYTNVYINGDFNNRVYILDKGDDYFIIERPSGVTNLSQITKISYFYDLYKISKVLDDLFLNDDKHNYYKKDNNLISLICKSYNDIMSIDSNIRKYTSGTISLDDDNRIYLKLFNYRNELNTTLTGNTINGVFYENDLNLNLRPVEILSLDNNNQTQMPIKIYENDLRIHDNVNNYTVDIVKDFNDVDVTLVDGLTLEILKIRYIWIFNAIIENAIIGEDDYGLVWYSGVWVCGEWVDGTWYSGVWKNGTWKNGKWYSYLIDKNRLLSINNIKILNSNKENSKFLNGDWKNGKWYNGIFGDEIVLDSGYSYTELQKLDISKWYNGYFYNGEFKKSVWYNGVFDGGIMYGGYWVDGSFNNGNFNGVWFDGFFNDGIFEYGLWKNGIMSNSKFGYNNIEGTNIDTEWINGKMNITEIYAGTKDSLSYNKTHLYNGDFISCNFYGGHLFDGKFKDGNFYNGVFGNVVNSGCTFDGGHFYNGLWLNGLWLNGVVHSCIWVDGKFINGNFGYYK